MSLRISNIFRQSQTELLVIYFTKINYQTDEKPDKTVPKSYLREVPSARPFVTVSLPSLDNLGQFLGNTAKMDPFQYLNM